MFIFGSVKKKNNNKYTLVFYLTWDGMNIFMFFTFCFVLNKKEKISLKMTILDLQTYIVNWNILDKFNWAQKKIKIKSRRVKHLTGSEQCNEPLLTKRML